MKRKECYIAAILLVTGTFLGAIESAALPEAAGAIVVPTGWRTVPGGCLILRGPGEGYEVPRLALSVTSSAAPAAATALREGWRRVTDGREVIDDDDEPLGGRVWQRIRVRFAVGPLAVVQTAWIGTVGGRTVVAVLSSGDDHAAAHLVTAAAAVASISAPR